MLVLVLIPVLVLILVLVRGSVYVGVYAVNAVDDVDASGGASPFTPGGGRSNELSPFIFFFYLRCR